jgi:hypothetical protein
MVSVDDYGFRDGVFVQLQTKPYLWFRNIKRLLNIGPVTTGDNPFDTRIY